MSGSADGVHELAPARPAGEIASARLLDQSAGHQAKTRAGAPAGG